MSQFRIDQLGFYVWALSQDWPSMPGGYDSDKLKQMAPDYENCIQANLETIDNLIEDELQLDADHQRNYWLWVDRAIEAIGMLEADGLDLGSRGKIFAKNYYRAHRTASHNNAFISLVQPNLRAYKEQIHDDSIIFDAVPNHPAQDANEIAAFNHYATEILNDNNWPANRDKMIHQFAAYGNCCAQVDYRIDEASADSMFMDERLESGDPIPFEEYMRFRRLIRAHKVEFIDSFEVIAHRNAAGEDSWDIAGSQMHPYVHRVQQKRVAWLKQKYPKVADKIRASTSEIYMNTNPKSFMLQYNDEDQATLKSTWIRFPVNYKVTVPVLLDNGDVVQKIDPRNRSAIGRIDRIEGVGIVDMELDKFAHNMLPIAQAVNYPSMKHSRGIGLCKFGYAPQKVHQIMFNGRLRMFERMTKGGGWYFKDVISKKEIQQQQKEGTWIGIDHKKLPAELAQRPINDLITNNQDMQFPSVYGQLEAVTEQYINTAMNIPPSKKGFRAGQSARQDMALISQSDQISSSGKRNFEAIMMPLGKMIHSNIVQFDGERYNIEFSVPDPNNPNTFRSVILNQVINERIEFDPYAEADGLYSQWKIFPTKIRNNLKTLRFSTQISTRSIIPTNPTERRLFMNDFIQKVFPLTESLRGIDLLEWLVESGFGGMPGFAERIARLRKSIEEDRQYQMQIAQQQQQAENQKTQFEQQARLEELRQNATRLANQNQDNKANQMIDLIEVMLDAMESEQPIDENNLIMQALQAKQLTG